MRRRLKSSSYAPSHAHLWLVAPLFKCICELLPQNRINLEGTVKENLARKKSRAVQTERGILKKVRFAKEHNGKEQDKKPEEKHVERQVVRHVDRPVVRQVERYVGKHERKHDKKHKKHEVKHSERHEQRHDKEHIAKHEEKHHKEHDPQHDKKPDDKKPELKEESEEEEHYSTADQGDEEHYSTADQGTEDDDESLEQEEGDDYYDDDDDFSDSDSDTDSAETVPRERVSYTHGSHNHHYSSYCAQRLEVRERVPTRGQWRRINLVMLGNIYTALRIRCSRKF